MKTAETRRLESVLWKNTNTLGVFGAFEVTIGWHGRERVDYMTFDNKGTFRCYEVKVTKADFHSECRNSFVGHLNYYVMPPDLFEQVRTEIPDGIGVYVVDAQGFMANVKMAKRRPADADMLKNSMIRSLNREVRKQKESGDPLIIEAADRKIASWRRQCVSAQNQYHDLVSRLRERYGRHWEDILLPEEPENPSA